MNLRGANLLKNAHHQGVRLIPVKVFVPLSGNPLSFGQANTIAEHIDYVVGMKKAIGDVAAIKFAVEFYDALGAGRDMEKAFKFGCIAIDLKGIPEYLTPVLKKKS